MATQFPTIPTPASLPFTPPFPNVADMQKVIKSSVEATLVDVMKHPTTELSEIFDKYIKDTVHHSDMVKHISDDVYKKLTHGEHKSEEHHHKNCPLMTLYDKVNDYHHHIKDGKTVREIEDKIKSEYKDLTHEECRVLSCLLRGDGPVTYAEMLGMKFEDFMDTMKSLGERMI